MYLLKKNLDVVAFLLLAIVLVSMPQIDIWVSGLFHKPDTGFYLDGEIWVQFFYITFKALPMVVIPLLLVGIVISYVGKRFQDQKKPLIYLLVLLLLGPGLLVHTVFKDNWDRARPRNIEAFGGDKVFTPAFVISDQCEKNCSFVSGHAAMGFFFMALAFAYRQRRLLWVGILIGALVGLGRIVQGGHFFSDIIFAGFFVYFSCRLLAIPFFGSSYLPAAGKKDLNT
jgi:lipid A 4'-phosphatase